MVHVGLVLRSTLAELVGEMFLSWSIWTTQTSWRCGTLSLYSSTSMSVCVCVCVCVCVFHHVLG